MRFGLIIIFATLYLRVSATLVPYPEDLSSESSELFASLVQLNRLHDKRAPSLAMELMLTNQGSNEALRLWSKLTYSYILFEFDSIQKVVSIVDDSISFRTDECPQWLEVYYELNRASILARNGNYNQSERVLKNALAKVDIEYRELNLALNIALAENLREQGRLEQSMVKWHESLKGAEALKDSTVITNVYFGRGTVRFLRQELEKAEADYRVFYEYNRRTGNQRNIAAYWSAVGSIQQAKGNYEKAIELNIRSFEMQEDLNDLRGQGESLKNLALGYMGLSNWTQAFRYLEQAIELKTRANDLSQTTSILNNMGQCLLQLHQYDKALQRFSMALDRGRRNGQAADVINSYTNLIQLNTAREDYRLAFAHQEELIVLKDSLNKMERNEVIQELQVRYETEKKEREIELLQKESSIITNRWLTLAMGLFIAIVFGILFIDGQKRKHRHETQLLRTEEELRKSQLKNLNDQLSYNQKKLALYTENLIKKNELVGQLEERLKESVKATVPETRKSKKIMQDFSGVRILTEQDWDEFKELFDNVHRGLLDRLVGSYPELTLADQRIFLLTKLNLSTSQVANILGVSPDSVKKGRYRLKKKLHLAEETSLQEFVAVF